MCVCVCAHTHKAVLLLSVCCRAEEIKLLRRDLTSAQTPTLLQSAVKRSWLNISPPLRASLRFPDIGNPFTVVGSYQRRSRRSRRLISPLFFYDCQCLNKNKQILSLGEKLLPVTLRNVYFQIYETLRLGCVTIFK